MTKRDYVNLSKRKLFLWIFKWCLMIKLNRFSKKKIQTLNQQVRVIKLVKRDLRLAL